MNTFDLEEYQRRTAATRAALSEAGYAALLVFAQESLYYLFGYDGGGYVFFQCAVLPVDETPPVLLCRRPDVAQARDTSTITDISVWLNAEDQNPAADLRQILDDLGMCGERVGIETDSYGLTGYNHQLVVDAMDGFCELREASHVVRGQRLRKSTAEIEVIRRAAALADDAVDSVANIAAPGVLDSSLTAAALAAILDGGGDMPPAGPLVNSGSRAVYGRGVGGPRTLSAQDQVLVELAGTYRRYNCCIERTIAVGRADATYLAMYDLAAQTLAEMLNAFAPGKPLGRVDEIHRARLDRAGYADSRYAACGYSLGATYRPSWMDVPPMIYAGNPLILEPGMVFFPHVMLGDLKSRNAVGVGNTVLITESGFDSLSRHDLDLIRT